MTGNGEEKQMEDNTPATETDSLSGDEGEFDLSKSTEENYASDDMNFYGPFAHVRETLDYSYHSNYKKERQWLHDSIIEDFLEAVDLVDVNGNVCTTPTEPFLVFTAGAMGAGKGYTIQQLVKKGRFPLLAFVNVDPDEIRRRFPEFLMYAEKNSEQAGALTHKEAGYVAEILTLAALQAGKNVLVDGSLRDVDWYQIYFDRLRTEYPIIKIAILHVLAPREAVFQRAAERAIKTGRVVPRATLEEALEQVPRSVKILGPLADCFFEMNNAPGADDIELLTEGEDWYTFQSQWLQTCAWMPGKKERKQPFSKLRARRVRNVPDTAQEAEQKTSSEQNPSKEEKMELADAAIHAAPPYQKKRSSFVVKESTEMIHKSDDSIFYGPYSHIRKMMDYSYHSNYKKERQWLQDAIIEDHLKAAEHTEIVDKNGNVGTTPTDPWLVFTAGVMGAGKSRTIRTLREKGRFPLVAFVVIDPDNVRRQLPEYRTYASQGGNKASDMTRKEAGYLCEIVTLAALKAGKNLLVDGTLSDLDWYQSYISKIRGDFPSYRIAILHVVAPREAVLERAEKKARETGRAVPREKLERTLEQVPKSVSALGPKTDYVCELLNAPGADDIEIITEGESWETFTAKWEQTCVWVPGMQKGKVPTEAELQNS